MNFPDLPHFRQLQKDLWQWPKSRAAVMIGAGLSFNAEPLPGVKSRFPTWRQLVRAMFDEMHPSQRDESLEQTKAREDRFNSSNPLRIASEYEAAFNRAKLEQLICTLNPDSDISQASFTTCFWNCHGSMSLLQITIRCWRELRFLDKHIKRSRNRAN